MPYRPSPNPRPPKDPVARPSATPERAEAAVPVSPGPQAPVAMLRRFRRGRWTLTPV